MIVIKDIILLLLTIWSILGMVVTGMNMGAIEDFHEDFNWKQKIFICVFGGPIVIILVIFGYILYSLFIFYQFVLGKLENKADSEYMNDDC